MSCFNDINLSVYYEMHKTEKVESKFLLYPRASVYKIKAIYLKYQ